MTEKEMFSDFQQECRENTMFWKFFTIKRDSVS